MMTREEIDHLAETLPLLKSENPLRAVALSEELLAASNEIEYEKQLAWLHLQHADALKRTDDKNEAEDEYHLSITLAEETDNKIVLGRAYTGLGVCRLLKYEYAKAKELIERGVSIAVSSGDTVGQGFALGNLAGVYHRWGLNEIATGYAKDSYDLFKGTYNVSFPLFRLGSISVSAGDLESAIKFLSEALDVLKTYGHKSNMAPIYAELGSIYSRMGQLEKAREEYQKSLAVAEEMGDTFNTVNGLTLLVTVDINENKFDKAEAELNAILRRTDLPYHYERWCYYYLAHNEFVRGNPQKAIEIFAEAFHSDDQLKELRLAEGVYALSIEAYTVLQDWENAARFHKKLREFREQANTEQFKSRLTTAQSLIATEREKHEKELEKMKREQLERELSNTTLQLLTQTELLAEFREGILAVVRKAPPTEPIARELRERLKVLPCKSIDWDKFEAQFKAAHPEFLLTLKQQYPELSKMETRVCTLLRMNLKSADISRLTCLSERNIENHRYRIRKKLGLESDVNIHEFLAKF